jgi:hypothetical protein
MKKLPADAIIAPAKLMNYLLVFRPVDDKSGFPKFITLYPNKEVR